MFRNVNLSEQCLRDHKLRQESSNAYQLSQKNMERVKQIALKMISYPEYKEAFDYVDNLFPRVKVKNISIYKVASRDLISMGYAGIEGFYSPVSKIVVISGVHKSPTNIDKRYYIAAKIEKDEVIVHELCHYCYAAEGMMSISSEMREEFAYGWSIGYLRQKGYTDEQIVQYNFLPYLMKISFDEATKNILAQNRISTPIYNNYTKYQHKEFNRMYYGKIFNRAKEIANERGLRLIETYSKKLKEGTGLIYEEEDIDRFDILDL